MDNPTLQNRTYRGGRRILGIASPKTIHIPGHVDLIEAIVDAVIDRGTPPAQHNLTVGPTHCVLPALKKSAQVSLDPEANTPRLVRRCDVHTVAWTIAETWQCGCLCRRFFL